MGPYHRTIQFSLCNRDETVPIGLAVCKVLCRVRPPEQLNSNDARAEQQQSSIALTHQTFYTHSIYCRYVRYIYIYIDNIVHNMYVLKPVVYYVVCCVYSLYSASLALCSRVVVHSATLAATKRDSCWRLLCTVHH